MLSNAFANNQSFRSCVNPLNLAPGNLRSLVQDAIGGAAERAYEAITAPDGAIPSSLHLHHDGSGDQIAGDAASPDVFDSEKGFSSVFFFYLLSLQNALLKKHAHQFRKDLRKYLRQNVSLKLRRRIVSAPATI